MIGVPVKITRGAYRGAAGTIIRLLPGNPYPFEVEFKPPIVGERAFSGDEIQPDFSGYGRASLLGFLHELIGVIE